MFYNVLMSHQQVLEEARAVGFVEFGEFQW